MTFQPVRILLVEDHEDHIELMRLAMLDNHVANVVDRVADGESALRYLRREDEWADADRPNLVLLDLKLPKIDGFSVLRAIRADPELGALPVAVLSTSSSELDRKKALAAGANAYLTKPLSFEKLHQLVLALNLNWAICEPRTRNGRSK